MENEVLDYVMNTPGNTNPAILEQMLDANSGTKLPEPTPEDNGKVLGVSEGQYALVNGGGGGSGNDAFIVHATYDDITGKYVTTETVSEIVTAYNYGAGKRLLWYPDLGTDVDLWAYSVVDPVAGYYLEGNARYPVVAEGKLIQFTFVSDTVPTADADTGHFTIAYSATEYTLTPADGGGGDGGID